MSARSLLARRVVENPFLGALGEWQAAAKRLRRTGPSRSGTRSEPTVELWVAMALVCALGEEKPARVALEGLALTERVLRTAEVTRTDLLRLVSAAVRCHSALERLVGESDALRAAKAAAWSASFGGSLSSALRLERVVRDHDVLVSGETGSGKEAIAHAIALGTQSQDDGPAPFAALNIAAIPETLIESELFGHVRGAFTGAGKDRVGHVRSVAAGCLFLDEVGDLPLTAQTKLLRVMETDRVTPLGSDVTYDADVRYIAATHKDLRAMVATGSFRQDLYERLAGHVIRLPPLRERPEDIRAIGMLFARRYLTEAAPEWQRVESFLSSREAQSHAWPGNVRELQNCLRNVMLGIEPGLFSQVRSAKRTNADLELPESVRMHAATLANVESWYVSAVVAKCNGNHALAARVLGVDRATVKRKLSL